MAEFIESKLEIVMFPWLAFGHLIPFMNLSNELAKRGHNITFLLPKNAETRLQKLNLYPNLIKFHKLIIPHVDGLPYGAETTADVPGPLESLLATAFDELYDEIKSILQNLKPHFVFFDFAYWIPDLAKEIGGIKTLIYLLISPAALCKSTDKATFMTSTAAELVKPPPGYPSTTVVLHESEAKLLSFVYQEYGKGVTFQERLDKALTRCDVIAAKTCREIEGIFCEYIANLLEKPVIYTGPVIPEPKKEQHELSNWLEKFEPGSVVFCAFGSQLILEKEQFQQLVLGFELTELPFLLVVKPPQGTNSVEEALPEGFKQRIQEKGLILDCWVPQLEVLRHKSVGCFVTHCGYGSMWESLVLCDCQLVLLPRPIDHIFTARLMGQHLKVGVEVEKDENDMFTKENLCKAVKCVMDKDNQIGCLVKENHRKWKELLSSPGFMSNYIDNFIQDLHGLVVENS
ncbi:UDP-glycosyltransferase 79B6-like [Solanum pennellii]|uniref:Glycosyltransferase n=1 Tax=Solanum pennellii TaxID=28526 RepID=A0ABM1GMW1_SOLPN|nr:UDP-glycosyltransferase 79B6-like [Solanum pennellii]